jgi:inorganic pyrophosphatase
MKYPQQETFWDFLEHLIHVSELIIDRPKGTCHPRYPELVYPLDYGYLSSTTAGDGAGIDVWRGGLDDPHLSGVVLTADLEKRDAELKLLLGCSPDEIATIYNFHNNGTMRAEILLNRNSDVGDGTGVEEQAQSALPHLPNP